MSYELSIIIPCYNQTEDDISLSLSKISNYFKKKRIRTEIIISQNGSIRPFITKLKHVRVIYTKDKGLGIGLKNGISIARGTYFYFLPLDIPYKYSDFKNMFPLRKEYDILIGSKLHKNSVYKTGIVRKILSNIQKFLTSLILNGFPINDPNGTLFGKTKKVKSILKDIKSSDFFFSTELLFLSYRNNLKLMEVPVNYIKKGNKTTVNLYKDPLNYFKQLVKLAIRV